MAAQVEMFHLSKREIEARFTSSELVLIAWRSQEVSAQMNTETGKKPKQPGVSDHLINEEGEIDLRKATQEEAAAYLANLGLTVPMMGMKHGR